MMVHISLLSMCEVIKMYNVEYDNGSWLIARDGIIIAQLDASLCNEYDVYGIIESVFS